MSRLLFLAGAFGCLAVVVLIFMLSWLLAMLLEGGVV
jgi:hypothetical protein